MFTASGHGNVFAGLDLGSCCGRAKPFNVHWM